MLGSNTHTQTMGNAATAYSSFRSEIVVNFIFSGKFYIELNVRLVVEDDMEAQYNFDIVKRP